MRALLLCVLLITVCYGYKFLVYSPLFAHSHNTFMGKIADTLTEAGHDVTVLLPILDANLTSKPGVKSTKKTIFVDPDQRVDHLMRTSTIFTQVWTMDTSPFGLTKMVDAMSTGFGYNCENLIKQKDILAKLKAEKFDVAIAEPFYFCAFGIFEELGIETVISAFSGTGLDLISHYIGEPSSVSSLAAAHAAGERPTIGEKIKTLIGYFIGFWMFNTIANKEGTYLAAEYGSRYSHHGELLGRTSFSFINANPYIDVPRPIISKTVFIGGLAVDVGNLEKLDKEWDAILSERPQTVLISFGSVAKSKEMPEIYKQQILKVIESLPKVTFIWKYEEPTTMGSNLKNLHFSKWVPQKALLADKRLTLFVTHGGLASSTEVAYLGKPAVFIPLFADQPRNAQMIARHKTAIVLQKEDLASSDKIKTAILTILNDKSYQERATRFGEMLRNQPLSPKDLVVKHAEFAARFGPIKELDPPTRRLSFIDYYFLDVFALIGGILLVIVFFIIFLLKKCCCAGTKLKKE